MSEGEILRLFLCGDIMTGRGIDQCLAHPGDPTLHESFVRDARGYVALAERRSGRIPAPLDDAYVWGEALDELDRARPALRVVNLETGITTSGEPWLDKGIHYRMHPANVGCLTAAGIDIATVANNHVLDWGEAGLHETLAVLHHAGIATAGAGAEVAEASTPAVHESGASRVLVFAFAAHDCGVPPEWAAAEGRAGVWRLPDLSPATAARVGRRIHEVARAGDVVVASVHWGSNWGWEVPADHRRFAHALVEHGGVDLVYGHSSHHPRPIELHRGKLILHGCGDFLNDYEGIGGYEHFRGDLVLMYLPGLDRATGKLVELRLVPLRIERFRLVRPSLTDAAWLAEVLARESARFGVRIETGGDGTLAVRAPTG